MPRLLFLTGIWMIAIGLIHVVFVGLGIRPWEGVSGFRKPVLFFVSTGLTVWSIGWVRNRRVLGGNALAWWDIVTGYVLAFFLGLEVLLIAMQSWLGLRSHFNHETPWSTTVELFMILAIAAATVIVFRETWIAWFKDNTRDHKESRNLPADETEAVQEMDMAVRWGLLFLTISCIVGFGISYLGWQQISEGLNPETYKGNGIPKFPHGATIHALQTLPVFAFLHHWPFRSISNSSTFGGPRKHRLYWSPTVWAILAHVLLLGYALRQTLHGWGRVPVDLAGFALMVSTFAVLTLAIGIIVVGLASRWVAYRKRSKLGVLD